MADNRRYFIVPRGSWWLVMGPDEKEVERHPGREGARKRMYELNGWKYYEPRTNQKGYKKRG